MGFSDALLKDNWLKGLIVSSFPSGVLPEGLSMEDIPSERYKTAYEWASHIVADSIVNSLDVLDKLRQRVDEKVRNILLLVLHLTIKVSEYR
jgi:hypothetical protein